MHALVVGAGVVGLTVGVRLAESGYDVDVVARELPAETTSAVAAALWYPYRIQPVDKVLGWSVASRLEFEQIAGDPEAGVVVRQGRELLHEPSPDPWWASAVEGVTRLDHVPPPYRDGWVFSAPVIEMPVYLTWLAARLCAAGGTITRMALSALPAPVQTADRTTVVVNCSGIGSRHLAGDPSVAPVRGQVVVVEQIGLDEWTLDAAGPVYVVPRSHDIVVGGTEESSWEPRPDPDVAREIVERADRLVPGLAKAKVVAHRVGLRPGRPEVRLEADTTPAGGRMVHCYGHGGAGVTVSWGCADDVLKLLANE